MTALTRHIRVCVDQIFDILEYRIWKTPCTIPKSLSTGFLLSQSWRLIFMAWNRILWEVVPITYSSYMTISSFTVKSFLPPKKLQNQILTPLYTQEQSWQTSYPPLLASSRLTSQSSWCPSPSGSRTAGYIICNSLLVVRVVCESDSAHVCWCSIWLTFMHPQTSCAAFWPVSGLN